MHTSFLEKFGLSLLIAAWMVYGSNMIGDMLVHADQGNISDLRIVQPEGSGDQATQTAAAEPQKDFKTLLAEADPKDGAKVARKCHACHTIEKGGGNKVGPHLYGVVGRDVASVSDFQYSDALKGLGGQWTYDRLNEFLTSPGDYAPGTKMSFRGLGDVKDRADVIAYLRQQSDSPPPLPSP